MHVIFRAITPRGSCCSDNARAMAQNLVPAQKELSPRLPDLAEIGNKPHQPNISFPKREFGKISIVRDPFNGKWQWLHYDIERDVAFCHTCVKAVKTGTGDLAFLIWGYYN